MDREIDLSFSAGRITPEYRRQIEDMLDEFKADVLRAIEEGRQYVRIKTIERTYSLRWIENGRITGPGTKYETGEATLEVTIGAHPDAKARAKAEYEAAKC